MNPSHGSRAPTRWIGSATLVAALTVALVWAYWPTFCRMAERWSSDPQYSHGFLVPLFALIVLWCRRHEYPVGQIQSSWWGLVWFSLGLLLRFSGAYLYVDALDSLSLIPMLAGLCALIWGERVLRWSWPALAFLCF